VKALEPRNPSYEAEVRASFAAQAMMTELGVEIGDVVPGKVTLSMPFNARFTQQHGFLHGGVTIACADTACGFAALSLMPPDAGVLTVECKSSMLSPGRGERFRFTGEVIKPGRTLVFTEGRAWAVSGQETRLIATISATMMVIEGREDVRG